MRYLVSASELVVAGAQAMAFWGRVPIAAAVNVDGAVDAAVAAPFMMREQPWLLLNP